MRVSQEKVSKILEYLQQMRRELQGKESPDQNGEEGSDDMKQIFSSAAWLLEEQKDGEWEISEQLLRDWNLFIRRTYSPVEGYRYKRSEDILTHLDKFCEEFKAAGEEMEQGGAKYCLQNRPAAVCEHFIGRKGLLPEIHRRLQEEDAFVLYGMGGIGKSELAKAYAEQYASCYHTIVFCRFHEDLKETLIDDYQIAVKNLVFSGKGKRGERGWYFRKKQQILWEIVDENTLLVIDNFDVLSDERLRDITSLPCKVLFTSRTKADTFALPGMQIKALEDIREQRELFLRYYGKEFPDAKLEKLDQLLGFLDGHTLSVKLCASHLAESGMDIDDLYAQLKEKGVQECHRHSCCEARVMPCMTYSSARLCNPPEAISDGSHLTSDIYDQIQDVFRLSELGKAERAVLRYLSVMPLYGIELSRFLKWCQISDASPVQKLIARGLVEWERKEKRISMHPMIARAVRGAEKVSFSNCWPYVRTMCALGHQTWNKSVEEMKIYERYVYTLVELLQDTEKEPFLDLVFLVNGSWQLGYFPEAEQFGWKLYEYSMKKYGPQSTQTAHSRHALAVVYDNWGNEQKAGELFKQSYADYRNCENPHPFHYALTCHKYGKAMRYEKRYEESEQVLLQAQSYLNQKIEEEGEEALNIGYVKGMAAGALMDIYMELVELYLDWKRPKMALVWMERREREFQERGLYLTRETSQWHLYYNMGLCQMMLGDYEKADEALQRSLSYAEKYFYKDSIFIRRVKNAMQKLKTERANSHFRDQEH